jgi:hypothetical protein
MKRRQKAGAQSRCATARTDDLRCVAREAAHGRSRHLRIRFADSGWKPELRGGGGTRHGRCVTARPRRTAPAVMACADRHSRTCGEAEVAARTAPAVMACADRHSRTCSEAEVAARTAPAAMACADRHSRTRSEAEMVAWTAPAAMACADRHSRTRSGAEVAARTALPSWPAQTASVAHAAKRRWSHGRHLRPWFGVARRRRLGLLCAMRTAVALHGLQLPRNCKP